MILKKVGTSKYFNEGGTFDNTGFFVYCPQPNLEKFSLVDAFTTFTSNFIIIFSYAKKLNTDPAFEQALDKKLTDANMRFVIWLDELKQSRIPSAAALAISTSNKLETFLNFGLGHGSLDADLRILPKDASGGSVSYSSNRLIFDSVSKTKFFRLIALYRFDAFEDRACLFNQFIVPLKDVSTVFGKSTTVVNNAGGMLFTAQKFGKLAIVPSSPLILSSIENGDQVVNIEYFDQTSFRSNVDLFCTFFPFKDIENKSNSRTSYLEYSLKPNAIVETNFANILGAKFYVKDLTNFLCRVGIQRIGVSSANAVAFPDETNNVKGLVLKQPTETNGTNLPQSPNKLLLGYSGTEAISTAGNGDIKIFFKVTEEKVKAVESTNSLTPSSGSITSLPFVNASEGFNFYLDGEKTPMFGNKIESNYEHQKLGTVKNADNEENNILPMLPVNGLLARKDLESLKNLDRVFSSYRKTRLAAVGSQNTAMKLTPQGFSRVADAVSYIKKEKESFGFDRRHSESGFRFDVNLNKSGAPGAVDMDLQLSLSKEDVFFVINPAILKQAASGPTPSNSLIDILFKLGDFSVDLSELLDPSTIANPSFKEKIVIFKFGKKSFDEYVSNPATWSNHGIYDGLNSSSAKAIDEYFTELNTFAASNREKYSELNRIRSDAGWNGVVILNVPLAANNVPAIFDGLAASQDLQKDTSSKKELKPEAKLKFQFVAFPINRTKPDGAVVDIVSTSFSGLIDYDLFTKKGAGSDYEKVRDYLLNFNAGENVRFLLSKLLVKFTNSQIVNFESYAFLRLKQLFEDEAGLKEFPLTHEFNPLSDGEAIRIADLVRLRGSYQKNSSGRDEFSFGFQSNFVVNFGGSIIDKIVLDSATFTFVKGENEFRFDLGGSVVFNSDVDTYKRMFSFKSLRFENIGFKFKYDKLTKPKLDFDVSNLMVLPTINFDGLNGFLSSFPLTFNRFQTYRIKTSQIVGLDFVTFDFNNHALKDGVFFGLVFDFDLGTLGDIEALKALKGEILIGWSRGKGFKLGLKLKPTGKNELHIDLFGALKLDIERYDLCSFNNAQGNPVYFLRLINARLTILGLELPSKGKDGKGGFNFNGLIYAAPGQKTAWFLTATKRPNPPPPPPPAPQPKPIAADSLVLGLGQRVGLPVSETAQFRTVEDCITAIMKIFKTDLDPCSNGGNPASHFYQPDRNWLVASDSILPEEWRKILDFRFVFNDPVLYGVHLQLKDFDLGSIDIIYKKVADNLGVWSFEYQLPNSLRSQEMGGASVTLPNIGIDIYTNGDWKLDIGFPRGDDWRRSAMIQIRTPIPLVGWAGFYLLKSTRVEETLFFVKGKSTLPGFPERKYLILQAGLAIRVGVGAYIDKGIFYAGASISVYGILEGSFAFEGESGLKRFFPDHFALMGRVGVIAEIVGYVDFKIIKAAVFVRLSVEVGLLLIMIKGRGLLPAPLYIQGTVSVSVVVTICCFKVFGREICIRIRFSFQATVRFEYTIGGGSSSLSLTQGRTTLQDRLLGAGRTIVTPESVTIPIISITHVPIAYIPGVTNGVDGLKFTHNFAVPFFGISTSRPRKRNQEHTVNFSECNVVRDIVQKLFQDLTAGLKINNIDSSYENIRQILLNGEVNGTRVELTFDNYRPWLITDLDITKPSSDGILHDVFKLDPEEIKTLRKTSDPCPKTAASGVNDSNCIFRIFPIPIAKNIIVGPSLGTVTQFANGFSLSIKNIADVLINCDINEITDYSDPQLEEINQWFDSYRTQFLARKNQRIRKVAGNRDLRKVSIIPEYFKLIGLLTLEAYYGHVLDSLRDKESTEITPDMRNPLIDPEKISNSDAAVGWKFNDSITNLVGQINYFYNNGLRLPNDPLVQTTTTAYFKTLKQVSDISGVASNPTHANVEVKISDPTSTLTSVDIKNEVFPNQAAIDEFTKTTAPVGRIPRQKTVNFQYLKNAFIKGDCTFTDQFTLEPVRLQIQNLKSKVLNPDGSDSPRRFFPIPDKLFLTAPDGLYRMRLNRNKRSDAAANGPRGITEFATICANVSVKVGYVPISKKVQIVEISNVFVDDLSLTRLILTHATFLTSLETINFYQKVDGGFKKIAYDVAKQPKIVKTNLSNKTHPPVIGVVRRKKIAAAPDVFIAELSDRVSFTRLLWEALTTNDGGYFLHFDTPFEPIVAASEATASQTQYFDLVVSFELKKPLAGPTVSEIFPAFCNYINLANINDMSGDLFKNLDDNAEYLYVDLLSSSKQEIREYHPQVPPHCAGFELVRNVQVVNTAGNPQGDEYSHYLPLEFDLTRKGVIAPIISRERVLPLMPTQAGDESKLLYKHVTPLVKYDPADFDQVGPNKTPAHKNSNRYDAVGNSFKFAFGLRDTYGFRAIPDLGVLQKFHEQKYFDKLVPVSAWSLIDFSYWLKDFSAAKGISWDVKARISLRDLVDLMGLANDPSNFDSIGNIQLSVLTDSSVEQNLLSVLRNLYTIKAQLSGPDVTATIGSQTTGSIDFLKRVVARTIAMVLDFANTGKFAEESLTFSVTDPTPQILRTLLEPSIQIERRADICLIPSAEAWDADTVKSTIHKIKASAGRYLVVNCRVASDDSGKVKAEAIMSIWAESNEKKIEFVLMFDKQKLLKPQATFLPQENGQPTGSVSISSVAGGIKIVVDVAKPLEPGNISLIKIAFETPTGISGVVPIGIDKCAILDFDLKPINVDNAIGGKVSFDTKPRILEPSNSINLLHHQINEKTNGDLGLGISSNDKGEKLVYLIRQKTLRAINFSQTLPLDRQSYYGILPINIKLWSGTYKDSTFVNVDLDAALQTLLAKIDSVLSAESVKSNITEHQADISNLIAGKKQLVENRLKHLIANVEKELQVPKSLTEEFRNLILRRLADFYNFDGIISLTLDAGTKNAINPTGTSASELNRLTVSIRSVENYNLISSKIGCSIDRTKNPWAIESSDQWAILFDQITNSGPIQLNGIEAEVSHIEFGIRQATPDSEVEASQWIQLLEPVVVDRKITVDQTWNRIVRRFPPKPVILDHLAQMPSANHNLKLWDPLQVGKWEYLLRVADVAASVKDQNGRPIQNYDVGDKIYVKLTLGSIQELIKSDLDNEFFGFLAYWSSEINRDQASSFDLTSFAKELQELTKIIVKKGAGRLLEPNYYFTIEKAANATDIVPAKWKAPTIPADSDIKAPLSVGFAKTFGGHPDDREPFVAVRGFDILDEKVKIVSVSSEIWVTRNEDFGNVAFRYTTEHIFSANPATPHLHFTQVLELKTPKTFSDILTKEIPKKVPFKTTGKWVLNAGKNDDPTLPVIPVKQVEFAVRPQADPGLDSAFINYANGKAAISLVIYNQNESDGLPIFQADLIKKEQ